MYVGIGFDSRVQQAGADLKAISLRQVKCAESSHSFDPEHVWITFMSAVEVINNLLSDLHVSVSDFFFLGT